MEQHHWMPRFRGNRAYNTDGKDGRSEQAKKDTQRSTIKGTAIGEEARREILRLHRESGYSVEKLAGMDWRGNDGIARQYHRVKIEQVIAETESAGRG